MISKGRSTAESAGEIQIPACRHQYFRYARQGLVEAQKVLLELGRQQHEIVMTGVKERTGGSSAATAMANSCATVSIRLSKCNRSF
jgi:hypothetical protein